MGMSEHDNLVRFRSTTSSDGMDVTHMGNWIITHCTNVHPSLFVSLQTWYPSMSLENDSTLQCGLCGEEHPAHQKKGVNVLRCGHSFCDQEDSNHPVSLSEATSCLSLLIRSIKENGSSSECPICRRKIDVSQHVWSGYGWWNPRVALCAFPL